jgi:uncharacterized OB-fold protein
MGAAPSRIDYDTRDYFAGLSERRLMLARCKACEHWIHPPRACCPACWSDDVSRESPSGKATLFSYLLQPDKSGGEPSIVGWAELSEQERLIIVGPILGLSAEKVRIGAPLTLCWIERDGAPVPAFRAGEAP